MGPEPPTTIDKPKVIVAEGVDADRFLHWACQAYDVQDARVYNFGGVTDLRSYLRLLRKTPGFDQLQTLVVARDAERSGSAAFESAANALHANGFPVPRKAFSFARGNPRTAVIIFPGHHKTGRQPSELAAGALEDLCLKTVADDPLMECVDDYIECAREHGEPLRPERKARLHAFLAAKGSYAGLKLGEATRAGAWDLEHPALRPFKQVILAM